MVNVVFGEGLAAPEVGCGADAIPKSVESIERYKLNSDGKEKTRRLWRVVRARAELFGGSKKWFRG
jgi:hypothetical protein